MNEDLFFIIVVVNILLPQKVFDLSYPPMYSRRKIFGAMKFLIYLVAFFTVGTGLMQL